MASDTPQLSRNTSINGIQYLYNYMLVQNVTTLMTTILT